MSLFAATIGAVSLKHDPSLDDNGGLSPWYNPDASPEERLSLIKKIEARDIISLRVLCIAFGDTPNKNRMRTEPGRIPELASLAMGHDLVMEHSLDAREVIGEIFLAKERKGRLLIGQEVTEFSEMLAFAQGRRKHFSILFGSDRWSCSECGEDANIKGGAEVSFSCKHSLQDAELLATGELFFGHNAVTANPAWGGTEVLNPALLSAALSRFAPSVALAEPTAPGGTMSPEEIQALADIQAKLLEAVEALKMMTAERDEAVEELSQAQDEQLEAAFSVALSRGAVAEDEKDSFRAMKTGMGVKFATAQLSARKGGTLLATPKAQPAAPVGFPAGEFTPAETQGGTENKFSLASLSVAGGRHSKESLAIVKNKGSLVRSSFVNGLNKR